MRSHTSFSQLAAAAAFLVLLPALAWGQESPAPVAAPTNPAFVDYISKTAAGAVETESAEGHALGLMPCPLSLGHLTGQQSFSAMASLPALWDLRTQSKLTPVRNQSACGSCWSFATYGSLESWFMPSENLNFSENNLKNTHGFDWSCCSGGNHFLSAAYLGRWSGPVDEPADPYAVSCASPLGLSAQKHVQDVIFFPDRADANDNTTIKQAVYTLGGVYTTMYYADPAFNDLTDSYYYTGSNIANHAVTIVGWDDSYDRTKFPTLPPANGAFIIKNTWGSGWGQSGYFYISYWDTSVGKDNAMFEGESATNYSRIYQYDPLGWVGSLGYSTTTAWFANVFTAASDESLAAASWYSASAGSTYTLYVYLDPTSGPINPAGPVATKSGTLDTAGYHTVRLDASVALSLGHKFSVVARLTTPGYYYPIPYEFPYAGYSSGATSSPGQSYISSAGTSWSDIASSTANSNVCLKAFTIQGGTLSVAPSAGLTSIGNQGGPFTPISAQYTLSNPGSAAINWSATHLPAAGWVTVFPTSGTLASGGSTTVTVSINSGANALAVGSYADTVTFTNTTNGAGSTNRSVQLAVSSASGTSMVVTPPDNFSSTGPAGGPFSPDRLQYTVSNVSSAAIDFTVTHDIGTNWLTCYNTLPAHTNTSITALINQLAGALSPGVYQDTIAFTNLTNGQGNTTRIAQLTVTGAALNVTPSDGLVSSGNAGGSFSPSIKQYTLTNTGGSPINWTASHGGSVNWVSLSGTSGTLAGGSSTTVAVSINSNANSLAAGVYSDTVSFANATNGLGNTTRPVSLTVYQGVLSVTPADGLSTTGAVGGPFTPSSKQYTLANTGNAPINWTASHSALVNWVTLSGTSGTLAAGASTTLTVSIGSNANSLPGGTYSDTVAFTNTTNGVGNTSRPVSLVAGSKILTSVAVSPSALLCPSTDPRQVRATAYFSDSTTLDVTSSAIWASSATSICRVSSAGVVTPVAQGSANVTCSYTSGGATKQATCAVSVSYQTIWYLYVAPTSYTFYSRNPVQFTAQGRTTSSYVNLRDSCEWSSSAPAVATVSPNGLVTPLSKGVATITARYLYKGAYLSAAGSASVQ